MPTRSSTFDEEMSEALARIHAEVAAKEKGITLEQELAYRRRGGQPGNRNAVKPRRYTPAITPLDLARYESQNPGSLSHEIAVLRALIRSALGFVNETDNSGSYLTLMHAITQTSQAVARLAQINAELHSQPTLTPAPNPTPQFHSISPSPKTKKRRFPLRNPQKRIQNQSAPTPSASTPAPPR